MQTWAGPAVASDTVQSTRAAAQTVADLAGRRLCQLGAFEKRLQFPLRGRGWD